MSTMNSEAARSEYLHTDAGPTANLNLTADERTSLIVGIDQALRVYGVTRNGDSFGGADYAPDSHVGNLVGLARRLDAMACGRRTWNRRAR
jgi:hypothetical protein